MSERALSLGCVKRIAEAIGDSDGHFVGYRPTLKPPFFSGQWFVSVGRTTSSRGKTTSGDVNDRVYTTQVCVTCKYGYAPDDRAPDEASAVLEEWDWGDYASLANSRPPILDLADRIGGLLIEDYGLVNDADTFIKNVGVDTNGFVEPFHQMTVGDIQTPGPAWCGGDGGGSDDATTVETVTITLSGARRLRVLGTLS